MNRNHLALFHAVAQAGSISRAAVVVRISQPAVSKQVAELEDELGVRLLDRLPRGVRLTRLAGSWLIMRSVGHCLSKMQPERLRNTEG